MAKLDDMMGALGGMPEAGKEPEAEAGAEDTGEVSDEEMSYAEEMGFDATKAKALKRFIRSCMASEEAGEYEEPEAEAEAPDMGEM